MVNYSNEDDVRELCGNVNDTEFPDVDITKELNAADSWVNTRTHKSDWDTGDTQYYFILKAATKMAAVFVLEHYGSEFKDKWVDLREQALAMMQEIVDNIPDDATGLDENIMIQSSNYGSYPLSLQDDPEASPYISTTVSYNFS